MFGFGMPELVIILLIVMVVFGAAKLPELGAAMGKGIKNFKRSVDGKDEIELSAENDGRKA